MQPEELIKNIFLVDDDEDDCYLTTKLLKELYPFCTVKCLYEGYALFQLLERVEPRGYPDLILLDLNMPTLAGFDVLKVLKEHASWRKIPVVILTTSSYQSDKQKATEFGASLFLTKPTGYSAARETMMQLQAYLTA